MLHRPPTTGGRGTPTCEGAKGQGRGHSKHGLAQSPEPLCPPGSGQGLEQERPGGGQGPREIVLSGCVPEKGPQTPAKPYFLWHLQVGGVNTSCCGPWTHHRPGGLSYTQIGCYLFFHGSVHMPGSDTHVHMHTHTVYPVNICGMNSHTRRKGRKHTATKMDTNSPSHPHTVHVAT